MSAKEYILNRMEEVCRFPSGMIIELISVAWAVYYTFYIADGINTFFDFIVFILSIGMAMMSIGLFLLFFWIFVLFIITRFKWHENYEDVAIDNKLFLVIPVAAIIIVAIISLVK